MISPQSWKTRRFARLRSLPHSRRPAAVSLQAAGRSSIFPSPSIGPSEALTSAATMCSTLRFTCWLRWHSLAVVTCLLGMATKEVMYAAPLLVLLHDRTFSAGTFREALRRRPWFYVGLAAIWLLLGWLVKQAGNRGATAGFGLGITPW